MITWPSWRRAEASRDWFYKHGPPGGGQERLVTSFINIAAWRRVGAHQDTTNGASLFAVEDVTR